MASRPWRGEVKIIDQWMSHFLVRWRGADYEVRVDQVADDSDIWDKETGQKALLVLPRETARELKLCR